MIRLLVLLASVFATSVADARVIRGGTTPPPPGFNGGATQVNVNVIPNRAAFPFADMMKNSGIITISGGAIAPPNTLDANGYPTSGTWSKSVITPLQSEKPGNYFLKWLGGGPNTVMLAGGFPCITGSLNGVNGSCEFTPTTGGVNTQNNFNVGVATTGASYSPVTRLSVVHQDDLAAWQLDQNAFENKFLSALAAGKYGVVRFLNWQGSSFDGTNASNWTDWDSRKPLGHHSFQGAQYRADWWAGNPDNGGSGNDYTLTTPASPTYKFGNGAPVDKQIMHVRFNQDATLVQSSTVTLSGNTINWSGHPFTGNEPVSIYKISGNLPTGIWSGQNYYVVGSSVVAGVSFQISATPGGAAIGSFGTGASGNYGGVRLITLNINGAGAVPIKNVYGDPLTTSGELPRNLKDALPVYGTLVYDADLNSWIKNGGDNNAGNGGINNAVPPEVQLSLAIQIRAHPWFLSSALALDPMTDYWPTFAAYVKANAPSWMIPRYEPVNEQWNFGTAFWGTRYAWNKSWHHWQTQFDNNSWQGKTVSTLGQAVNAVYGGQPDGTKYWLVNGMQAASAYYFDAGNTVTQNNQRMTASNYVGQAAPAQSGYIKAAASNYTTHVAPANYYTPFGMYQKLNELQTAILYGASHANSPASRAADLNSYANSAVGATTSGSGIFTIASPGIVNWTGHPFVTNDMVVVYTQGTLPTGLATRVGYWVNVIDANSFNLKPSKGGALINFTGSQSGQHSISDANFRGFNVSAVAAISQAFVDWAGGYTNNAGNTVKVTYYEGDWSPDTGGGDATTTVTAATNAANAVVTIGANTTLGSGASVAGVGAQVGGSVNFSSIGGMTQLNTSTFTPTFVAGGSANITGANSLILNQAVTFTQQFNTDFQVPPEIVAGTPYYVVSTGNPFQISATRGGSPITFAGSTSYSFGIVATPGWFVTNVAGQNITLDVDSSAFGAYTSGGTMTYTASARQVTMLRVNGRLASDLEGIVYGNTWPVPSLYASLAASGGVFPSKYLLSGTLDAWSALQPNVYLPYPTTGEWIANRNFSPGYNFLLKRDLDPASNDNDPMWLEKAA